MSFNLESIIENYKKQYNNEKQLFTNRIMSNYRNILRQRMPYNRKKNYINRLKQYYYSYIRNLTNKLNSQIAQAQSSTPTSENNKKKALLIGCNYTGTANQLNGCINDVENIQTTIKSKYGFNDILLMTDNTSIKPTYDNIINEFTKIIANANEGEQLFVSFSGHGTYTKDTNNDEKDGLDEMFVALDLKCIKDDDMKTIVKNNLKKDVTLFVLFDCCHSGTILDLKYQYLDSTNYDTATENDVDLETNGNVFMISGCMDAQTSADAYINSMYQGAMSWALLDTINNLTNPTWKEVITKMRNTLKSSKFTQIPQLSSGKALDLNAKFCLV